MDCWVEFVTGAAPVARSERRFATVLFTDIVGSTAQAARVGDAAWRTTMEGHDRLAWRAVGEHSGKLIKNTGDGLLVTFDSPSAAIACTSELTLELSGIGITIRAGLHAGEIEVREDGDVTGLAVNLAARVEQAARDGTTYVSSTVRELLLGGEHAFEDRGEHELKGIPVPGASTSSPPDKPDPRQFSAGELSFLQIFVTRPWTISTTFVSSSVPPTLAPHSVSVNGRGSW